MFYQSLMHPSFISKPVRLLFITVAFFILTLAAQPVSAATITVTNTADSGAGSLRQAVADANGTPADDTINFNIPLTDSNCNSSGVCTITLTGGVIMLQAAGGNLTIANQTGAGKLLISGNNASRVFEGDLNANFSLDGLTVTHGVGSNSGGRALGVVTNYRGTLTIMNSVFTQNPGEFVIAGEAFGPNGSLNVFNTTVNDNTGTGIYFSNGTAGGGTANIVNSTISNNDATGFLSGTGIRFLGDILRITNSTISGNEGGGGITIATMGQNRSVVLTNCTITANSAAELAGGINVFQANIKLRNTIVAGNTSSSGTPDLYFLFASGTSLGNNLIGNSIDLGTPNAVKWHASDILNQNARLAPLGNYGGATQTHALLPSSPAIDAGNNCVLTANGCGDENPAVPTDQRGAVRVGTVDIGSFEFTSRPVFDFDGDYKTDVSIFRPSAGEWWYLRSSDNSNRAFQFGAGTDKIAAADYTGDGLTDIAFFRPVSGEWFFLRSEDSSFYSFPFGTQGDIPTPNDFDGDGLADVAVLRPSNSTWYILNSSDNSTTIRQFGASEDLPVASDYDGDGKADFAIFRPSDGTWWINHSSTQMTVVYGFGTSTDKTVPMDYTGDGKTDVAFWRPSTGEWFILRSENASYYSIPFGASGDTPAPGDYDGDGRGDYAIFRPSIATWYVQQSTNGFAAVTFGATGDQPVPNAFVR